MASADPPEIRLRPGLRVGTVGGSYRVVEDARVNARLRVCVVCEGPLAPAVDAVSPPRRFFVRPGEDTLTPLRVGVCGACGLIYVLED